MSMNDSCLCTTGFDYVVAVTQDSINGALEEYLYHALPEVTLCYVYDNDNNPVAIDCSTLVSQTDGVDPFSVPDGTSGDDSRVQALNSVYFAFAIKARLGLPPGMAPAQLPPIVVLQPGQSNVIYTLMFAEFIATELVFGPRGSVTWVNQAQPSGTDWTFSGAVDLNFQDAAFTSLPPAVQKQLKGIGDQSQFNIQQLYYDLNSSNLEQGFTFNNVPSNSILNAFMAEDFINTYWKALGGAEVLGYGAKQITAIPTSSLAVTDLNFFTPEAVGSQGAPLTLNYLCATNNDPLPSTSHADFGWNWVEPDEVSQFDGVVALNRNTFARYLSNALDGYVESNCYYPWVELSTYGFLDVEVKYQWDLTPDHIPTITFPSGSEILNYSYKSQVASGEAGDLDSGGAMQLSSTFDLTVSVEGNKMTIVQHLVVWCYVRAYITKAQANIVDKQITDVYTFAVDEYGQIIVSTPSASDSPPTSVTVDNSQVPRGNGFLNFFADVDKLAANVAQWAQSCAMTSLQDIPTSTVQNFVFPGGATFTFADVSFSDNQDLVSHIVYADVT